MTRSKALILFGLPLLLVAGYALFLLCAAERQHRNKQKHDPRRLEKQVPAGFLRGENKVQGQYPFEFFIWRCIIRKQMKIRRILRPGKEHRWTSTN